MKLKSFAILALVLMFGSSLFGAPATVTGVLTDNMCTKKHMMPGKPNADCVRECIKHGAMYVIVTNGKVLRLSGNEGAFNALAGEKVTVTGNLKGTVIAVTSIEATQ